MINFRLSYLLSLLILIEACILCNIAEAQTMRSPEYNTKKQLTIRKVRKGKMLEKRKVNSQKNLVLQETVSGTVTEASTNKKLPGVNIKLVGSASGTTTDKNGHYNLNLPSLKDTLRFSFVGFRTRIVPIKGRNNISIALESSVQGLDEVVVTGTGGGLKKRAIGSKIASIDTKDLKSKPVSNVTDLLAGATTGITTLAENGQVGTGGNIKLRGVTSISQGNYPLVFVDGIRLATHRINAPTLQDNRGARTSQTPLNFINPEDIARIEIVKGASATTLYGSEASAGVVQIFTREGHAGETHGSFSVTEGANFWPQVGKPIRGYINDLDLDKIRETGIHQAYNASVSGGDKDLNYYVSGGYFNEEGIVATQKSKGWSATSNINFQPVKNLKISFNNLYAHHNTRYVPDTNNRHAYVLNTMLLETAYKPGSRDPSWVLKQKLIGKVNSLTTGISIVNTVGEKGINSLKNHVRLGLNRITSNNRGILPFGYYLYPKGTIGVQKWKDNLLTAEYTGNWEAKISSNIHSNFAFGGQLYSEKTHEVKAGGLDFSGPGKPTVNSAARNKGSETLLKKVDGGLFVQETININDSIYFIGGLRADGNSAFGKDYGLQYYPKGSISYVLSDASFWNIDWMTSFRIRGAIGYAGKAPGAFDAVKTYQPTAALENQPAVFPAHIGNPNLGPENTREIEAGFDAELFNSRIKIDLTYYNDKTNDALIPVTPVPSSGFTEPQLENAGILASSGLEISSNFIPIRNNSIPFQWSVGLDLTTINSDMKKLGTSGVVSFGYNQFVKQGYPAPSFFGRKVTNPNEHAAPIFENNAFLGRTFPNLIMVFNTEFNIGKNLSINARGELNKGGHILNAIAYYNSTRDYWKPTLKLKKKKENEGIGALTAAQRAKLSADNFSDFIEKGDFFKLRILSVNYALPKNWVPQDLNRVTVSVMANNLIKISNYGGLDPENSEGSDSGTAFFRRVDYYTLPPKRSINFKVSVDF